MPYSYNRYSSDSYRASCASLYGVKDILGGRTPSNDPSADRSRPSYSFSSDLERTKSEAFRPATRYTDSLRDLDSQLKSLKLSSSTPSNTSTSSSHYLRRPATGLYNRETYNSSKYGTPTSSQSRYDISSSQSILIPPDFEGKFECRICFEIYDTEEHFQATLKCGHAFGENCIRAYLQSVNRCALCNQAANIHDLRRVY
ncbi:Oidioi.mRNA.OKI2018_I69.PAR.g11062.t1.cds [Oikopleura dioica]|uniref:Oidioi.mRNA.OKI2018_I69.PAR.g11062.t1.cds n=1 Tax=Oikopleura dioica TaxID=34765 RepID=A0ABN7RTV5_OIKDI|nr:Oidioi.mRNA.OKI2018_I69.PAR.g11062.t1.cds [Oikopleura dioica]